MFGARRAAAVFGRAAVLGFLQVGYRQVGLAKVHQRDGVKPLVTEIMEVEQLLMLRREQLGEFDL